MLKKRWSVEIKDRAKFLRLQGYTYGQLVKELDVPKSTIHVWIRGTKRPVKFSKLDRIRFLREIQPLGAKRNKKIREEKINQIINQVNSDVLNLNLNKNSKRTLLSILYLAEGGKGRREIVNFANTDPRLTLLFVTLLRECYELDEAKFRIRLHLHYYHRVKVIKKFWSELLSIPKNQFTKIYRKSRSKEKTFRRNFGGICFVKYNSLYLRERIVYYGYSSIEKLTRKIEVPVA